MYLVLQEAVSTGDPELVQLCLQHRDYQRSNNRTEGVPALLQRLREVSQTSNILLNMLNRNKFII